MIDNKPEEQKLPLKEIQVGNWFNPWKNYSKIPYSYFSEYERAKENVNFTINGLGSFSVTTYWEQGGPEFGEPQLAQGVIILLDEDRPIPLDNNPYYEKEFEIRLVWIGAVFAEDPKNAGHDLPYQVEIKTPSGNIYYSDQFTDPSPGIISKNSPGDKPAANFWFRDGSNERVELFVPETERVFDKMQMRIVPTEGGEN